MSQVLNRWPRDRQLERDSCLGSPGKAPCKPSKSPPATGHSEVCPCCERPMVAQARSIPAAFATACWYLITATWMIACLVTRCVRFALASVLCSVGFVGSRCGVVGARIAHPNDRRFLLTTRCADDW